MVHCPLRIMNRRHPEDRGIGSPRPAVAIGWKTCPHFSHPFVARRREDVSKKGAAWSFRRAA